MTLPTFEFYKNTYFGDEVEESSFPKFIVRAYDRLNPICMMRLADIEEDNESVHKCLCAVADFLNGIDNAMKNANDPLKGNIKSMSSGGESISFGSNESIYTICMSDTKKQNEMILEIAKRYLTNTGLLYWGI